MIIASMINPETCVKSQHRRRKADFVVKDRSFFKQRLIFVKQDSIPLTKKAQNRAGWHPRVICSKAFKRDLILLTATMIVIDFVQNFFGAWSYELMLVITFCGYYYDLLIFLENVDDMHILMIIDAIFYWVCMFWWVDIWI